MYHLRCLPNLGPGPALCSLCSSVFSVIRFCFLQPILSMTERTRSMPEPQSYKNHARWFPPFHFFAAPVLVLNLIFAIALTIHHWQWHRVLFLWYIVVSLALIVLATSSRVMALKAQDRLICLEERLRFTALLPADLLARSKALTEDQLIGLRFASDDELPALVKRALDESLTRDQIKKSINSWRPDYFRV